MATRDNKYAMKVDPNADELKVKVIIKERESGEVYDEHTFNVGEIHASLQRGTLCYGASKLYQDRSSSVPTGPEKLSAMKDVHDQLVAGLWEKERKSGSPTVSAEVEALAQLKTNGSIPAAQASLAKYDKAQREKILGHPKVVELAASIREARTEVDTTELDDMLAATG